MTYPYFHSTAQTGGGGGITSVEDWGDAIWSPDYERLLDQKKWKELQGQYLNRMFEAGLEQPNLLGQLGAYLSDIDPEKRRLQEQRMWNQMAMAKAQASAMAQGGKRNIWDYLSGIGSMGLRFLPLMKPDWFPGLKYFGGDR